MDSYDEQRSSLWGKSTPAHLVSIALPSGGMQLSFLYGLDRPFVFVSLIVRKKSNKWG